LTNTVSAEWQELLRLLPKYDPFAQAQDCWFDAEEGQYAIDFIEACITHVEGALAGKPFKLEAWQKSFAANLFGWKRKDEFGRIVRRYREALLFVARKNGKTPFVAAIALYVFFQDQEAGQQDYIAASDREQAALLFRQCRGMVDNEPELAKRCKAYGGHAAAGQSRSLVRERDSSFLRVVSADAGGKHGGNPHLVIVDELHEQPNRELVDVFQTSFASTNRRQPLFIMLTTSDYERPSICNEKYDYACRVRDNTGDPAQPGYDPRFLPAIWDVPAGEDWTKEDNWTKANPNLGVSVSLDFLRGEYQRAREVPAYENTFRRLHCNQRTEQDKRVIQMDQWRACGHEADPCEWRTERLEALKGQACFAGLDLGATNDLTALVLLFPSGDKPWPLLPFFWATENAIDRRRRAKVPYDVWCRQGFMKATDSNTTDYDVVRADINQLANDYGIMGMLVDRTFQGAQLCSQLMGDGFAVEAFSQSFMSFAYPTRRTLELIAAAEFDHGNNPILGWMAGNVSTDQDTAGNLKFSKSKSGDKIDGIVALTMAVAKAESEPALASPTVEVW
jgi:phage terminase large subunit-like protein